MPFIGSILPLTINSENAWSFQTAVMGNNLGGVPQLEDIVHGYMFPAPEVK